MSKKNLKRTPDVFNKIFELKDNVTFGKISGDVNPLHINEIIARRTIFGLPLVHGMHIVLWGLENALLNSFKQSQRLTQLNIKFRQPVRIGQKVSCRIIENTETTLSLKFKCLGRLVCTVNYEYMRILNHEENNLPLSPLSIPECQKHQLSDLNDLCGKIPLSLDPISTKETFPTLVSLLPSGDLALLLSATRLIGMECPGFHSIFLGADFKFCSNKPISRNLHYYVKSVHKVTGRISIDIESNSYIGTLLAGYRPHPVAQVSFTSSQQVVVPGEFSDQNALIIGGSRGLGETTAKLVAAGGGSVRLSYASGRDDAIRVCEEIRAGSGKVSFFNYDVTSTDFRLQSFLPDNWHPTHLYYFATPYISLNETTNFVEDLFRLYCSFYVEGFWKIFSQILTICEPGLRVFYPSTIAIDEILPKAAEYSAAKAAGETLCAHLQKIHPEVKIYTPRLPRLLTDQTATLVPIETADVTKTLLTLIRGMRNGN